MQSPVTFRPLPPMYTWPRSIKRLLLAVLVCVVMAAYMLLAGGVVAFLVLLAT